MQMMTHYMELLATNQPWNLLIFMAVPVICAETLAITELIILFSRKMNGAARKVNKVTGIFAKAKTYLKRTNLRYRLVLFYCYAY